jgi:hypothetical protein
MMLSFRINVEYRGRAPVHMSDYVQTRLLQVIVGVFRADVEMRPWTPKEKEEYGEVHGSDFTITISDQK